MAELHFSEKYRPAQEIMVALSLGEQPIQILKCRVGFRLHQSKQRFFADIHVEPLILNNAPKPAEALIDRNESMIGHIRLRGDRAIGTQHANVFWFAVTETHVNLNRPRRYSAIAAVGESDAVPVKITSLAGFVASVPGETAHLAGYTGLIDLPGVPAVGVGLQ